MDNPELLRLLDADGRVVRYPSKFKKRVHAVLYIAERFTSERVYTELEVNDIIRSAIAFADYVLIRRDLVDYRCLARTPDGRAYTRIDPLPTAEEILSLY